MGNPLIFLLIYNFFTFSILQLSTIFLQCNSKFCITRTFFLVSRCSSHAEFTVLTRSVFDGFQFSISIGFGRFAIFDRDRFWIFCNFRSRSVLDNFHFDPATLNANSCRTLAVPPLTRARDSRLICSRRFHSDSRQSISEIGDLPRVPYRSLTQRLRDITHTPHRHYDI